MRSSWSSAKSARAEEMPASAERVLRTWCEPSTKRAPTFGPDLNAWLPINVARIRLPPNRGRRSLRACRFR